MSEKNPAAYAAGSPKNRPPTRAIQQSKEEYEEEEEEEEEEPESEQEQEEPPVGSCSYSSSES